MSPESRELLARMNRMVLEADTLIDAIIVERYISLANRRLEKINDGGWDILGASLAIKHNYEDKFGIFVPSSEGVLL